MRVGVAHALADLSDFGLLGSKVYKNARFPALDADELPCVKNVTPLALSSAKKFVTVQTHTNKQ